MQESLPEEFRSKLVDQFNKGTPLKTLVSAAVQGNDQSMSCAIVQQYGYQKRSGRSLLDVLLKYTVSEEDALHAEKLSQTVTEEYLTTRPAFR